MTNASSDENRDALVVVMVYGMVTANTRLRHLAVTVYG